MAEPLHQIGAPIPFGALVRLSLKLTGIEVQRAPNRKRKLVVVGEAQCVFAIGLLDRGQALEIDEQGVGIVACNFGVIGIREGRIKQVAIFRFAVVHGQPEIL